MMNTVLGMGAAGSAVLLLWLPLFWAFGSRLPARWHYRILKIALFFLLVPVGRLLPLLEKTACTLMPAAPAVSGSAGSAAPALFPVSDPLIFLPASPAPAAPVLPEIPVPAPISLSADALRLLSVIWAAGAASVLACKALSCLRLRRVLRYNRKPASRAVLPVFWACRRELGIRGPVELWENPLIQSPLASGLRRPMVVIPSADLPPEELHCVFLHELTHIRSGDLWVRLAAALAQALHWYNPLAYLLCRHIRTLGERSCDERVVLPLSGRERYVYGNTIIALASHAAQSAGDWAVPLSAGEDLERRLMHVLHTEKLKGPRRILALILAGTMLTCGAAAALAAREPLPSSRETSVPAAPSASAAGDAAASEDTLRTVRAAREPLPSPRETASPAVPSVPAAGDAAVSEDTLRTVRAAWEPLPSPRETASPAVPSVPAAGDTAVSEDTLRTVRADWASSGVTAETPVVFGDQALILSRGGTLLPDGDPASYCLTGGVLYKQFQAKSSGSSNSLIIREYEVGNTELLENLDPRLLETLVNGEYPRNSGGESYGSILLSGYVGYAPDLTAVNGGYIRESEIPGASVSSPEEARAYMEWREKNPGPYAIPLYNAEGAIIGSFPVGGGGSASASRDGTAAGTAAPPSPPAENTPAAGEAESAPPAGAQSSSSGMTTVTAGGATVSFGVTEAVPGDRPESPFVNGKWVNYIDTALRGDPELIRSRGGTLLPDDEKTSYIMINGVMYKQYMDKNGLTRPEYAIGNLSFAQEFYLREGDLSPLDALTNGVYPKNESGESYGDPLLGDYVGYAPDLILLYGGAGYYRESDQSVLEHDADSCLGEYLLPLYASDGKTVTGTYKTICCHG